MNTLWKWVVFGAALGAFGYLISSDARAQLVNPPQMNFDNSPMNFNNSPMNFDNSPMNFNNSPMNFNNSPMNFDANNGIYTPDGARIGYSVVAPSGAVNLYDSTGGRIGYIPAPTGGK